MGRIRLASAILRIRDGGNVRRIRCNGQCISGRFLTLLVGSIAEYMRLG